MILYELKVSRIFFFAITYGELKIAARIEAYVTRLAVENAGKSYNYPLN